MSVLLSGHIEPLSWLETALCVPANSFLTTTHRILTRLVFTSIFSSYNSLVHESCETTSAAALPERRSHEAHAECACLCRLVPRRLPPHQYCIAHVLRSFSSNSLHLRFEFLVMHEPCIDSPRATTVEPQKRSLGDLHAIQPQY